MSLMDHLQVTAYTRLNTDAIRSDSILDFTDKIIENTGIVEDQIYLTEYSAVMTGVIQSGIQLPIPLLAALTAVSFTQRLRKMCRCSANCGQSE